MFLYKLKAIKANKAWMKHPEILQKCSTGLHFPSERVSNCEVEDFANLSFKEKPVYVGVDDGRSKVTVEGLQQGYCVVPSNKRFLVLYAFLKRNLSKKIMVFFSSCNSFYKAEKGIYCSALMLLLVDLIFLLWTGLANMILLMNQSVAKYEAAGELEHVKGIIKWGTDYLLKTFNSSADTIDSIVAQVGEGDTSKGPDANDHYCWMRPEDIDYTRPVYECHSCSDLASKMAASLAAASIVFKDSKTYSDKLVHGAKTLFQYGRLQRGRYSPGGTDPAIFYNSTGYWDEFLWGGSWLYFATGNSSYLQLATAPALAKHAGAFWGGPDYGVFSWDNKLTGSQVLLSRLRLFLSPGYPYEEILSTFHNQTGNIMCSYLPFFKSFNRTKGGLIQLNHGHVLREEKMASSANSLCRAELESRGLKWRSMRTFVDDMF
ncbi:hypothetical protein ZIOFF_031991 [Zingiber officinale]|uniref:cellulase n=1 Tax=Zingiber officinale TaxID=94328 RepID=A0A8J5GUR2_ZINOF|nr:hypothetical protein ZIOFF_031991 [Zingiber officinale]